jgi:hypothetical protein
MRGLTADEGPLGQNSSDLDVFMGAISLSCFLSARADEYWTCPEADLSDQSCSLRVYAEYVACDGRGAPAMSNVATTGAESSSCATDALLSATGLSKRPCFLLLVTLCSSSSGCVLPYAEIVLSSHRPGPTRDETTGGLTPKPKIPSQERTEHNMSHPQADRRRGRSRSIVVTVGSDLLDDRERRSSWSSKRSMRERKRHLISNPNSEFKSFFHFQR